MRRMILISLLAATLFTYGCNKPDNDITSAADVVVTTTTTSAADVNDDTHNTTATSGKENDEVQYEVQPKRIVGEGDAERLGVDKTLIWVMDAILPIRDEDMVRTLNELLVKKYGCDFVVEFHSYTHDNYVETVKNMMDTGRQADLVLGSLDGKFSDMVAAGIYEPITDRLATSEGQKLWEAYAPEVWKQSVERDGEIFGVGCRMTAGGRGVLACNKAMAEKLNIELPETFDFYDIENILENIEKEHGADVFESIHPIVISPYTTLYLENYYMEPTIGWSILFKKDAEGNWMAIKPAEDEDYIRLLEQIKKYEDRGWLTDEYEFGGFSKADRENGSFVFFTKTVYGAWWVDNKGFTIYEERRQPLEVFTYEFIPGQTIYVPYNKIDSQSNGIASWSEYKEEAYTLLKLMNTEEALSCLMLYGIESIDWRYDEEARKVINPVTGKEILHLYLNEVTYANINLLPSVFLDPDDKLAFSKEISAKHEAGPFIVHDVDISEYKAELDVIKSIYNEYETMLFYGKCDDVRQTISEMNERLEKAGIDRIIEGINNQMRSE